MPRPLIVGFAVFFTGCNEIRYQTARLRANAPALEVPKAAALPDRRVTFECKDGEPFEAFFTPGGGGAVISLGGEEFALPELSAIAGRRYGDGRYELSFKEDGVAALTFDDALIRDRCKRR